jgi:hypothetical protein
LTRTVYNPGVPTFFKVLVNVTFPERLGTVIEG